MRWAADFVEATTADRVCSAARSSSKEIVVNSGFITTTPSVLATAMLVALFVRTFGLARKAARPVVIAGKPDARGRTLQQRLNQSEVSFR